MKTREFITTINGTEIYAVVNNEGKTLVPVKPVCVALGVVPSTQIRHLKNAPLLSSVVALETTTGSDGKCYEMVCLPVEYIFGWLFSISPANVAESARAALVKYQKECYDVLFTHFYGKVRLIDEITQKEADLLARKKAASEDILTLKREIREIEQQLDSLSEERTNPQKSLFS